MAVLDLAGASPVLLGQASERGGRRAIELVEQALASAKCEREDIECLVIGRGPGSYTGIRGAISLAQGWQLGREVKILGISTAECLAAQARVEKPSGTVWIVIDAQRNEFYLTKWEFSEQGLRELDPLHLVPAAEVESLCRAGERVIGPDIEQWFPSAKNVFPDAAMLGRLAAGRSDFVRGEELTPIYLRLTEFVKAPPPRIIA